MLYRFYLLVIMFVFICSCESEIDKYYEVPDTVRGSAWEYLEEQGNYKLFLQAAQISGYEYMLVGKGLCTVFAPNDDAFSGWMQKKGYVSMEDVPMEELKVLVAYHLVQDVFSVKDLTSFSVDLHAIDPEEGEGECYRFKTFAKPGVESVYDPFVKKQRLMYHYEYYLPVVSARLLKNRNGNDPEGGYKCFFPDVNWQGTDDDRLYIQDATVTEGGITTSFGYIHKIDKVLEPLPTIYESLRENPQYSLFVSLWDRFANMVYNSSLSNQYAAAGDSLYVFYFNANPTGSQSNNLMPSIAHEWTGLSNDIGYDDYMRYAYNIFAPRNEVLQQYLDEKFPGYAIEDIPLIPLYYILQAYARNKQELILPQQIDEGLEGENGEEWGVTTSDVEYYEMCCNGVIYGIKQALKPVVLEGITAPLMLDKEFSYLSAMFNKADEVKSTLSIGDDAELYTLFVVVDTVLKNAGYMLDEGNANITKDESFEQLVDGKSSSVSTERLQQMCRSQIVYGEVETRKNGFYKTKEDLTYLYTLEDDDAIFTMAGNRLMPRKTWHTVNGNVIQLDQLLSNSVGGRVASLLIDGVDYSTFRDLLMQTGLLKQDENGVMRFTFADEDEHLIAFVPTNDALAGAEIPVDNDELSDWLLYYFVSVERNRLGDYVLPGFDETKTVEYSTFRLKDEKKDTYYALYIRNGRPVQVGKDIGSLMEVRDQLPLFAGDGIIYTLTQVIQPN